MSVGTFTAKVVTSGIVKANSGKVGVAVTVRCQEGDKTFDRTWTGWLSEAARPYTLENLDTMGYLFSKPDGSDLAEGKGFDLTREFSVVIEEEAYTDSEGNDKTAEKVRFINPLGGNAMKNKLAADDAVVELKGLNIEGIFADFRQKKGKPAPKPQEEKAQQQNFAADDIPF